MLTYLKSFWTFDTFSFRRQASIMHVRLFCESPQCNATLRIDRIGYWLSKFFKCASEWQFASEMVKWKLAKLNAGAHAPKNSLGDTMTRGRTASKACPSTDCLVNRPACVSLWEESRTAFINVVFCAQSFGTRISLADGEDSIFEKNLNNYYWTLYTIYIIIFIH